MASSSQQPGKSPYSNLQEERSPADSNVSDDDLRSAEWERRLMEGDLPADFLSVTEPNRPNPAVGQLIDVPTNGAAASVASSSGARPRSDAAAASAGAAATPQHQPPPPIVRETKPVRGTPIKTAAGTANPTTATEQQDQQPGTKEKQLLSTEEQDRAMALALQEQLNMEDSEAMAARHAGSGFYAAGAAAAAGGSRTVAAPANMIGRLTVTIVEAKLAKNYGLSRMDPYCRVRVGHSVYETPTCANGSKEPKWNKTFNCFLLQGIKNMDIEIYDECTFSQDAQIAHGSFPIPEEVIGAKEVADQWFNLSGAEGDGKEGIIHIILSLQPIAPGAPLAQPAPVRTVPNVGSGHRPMTYQAAYAPGGQQQPVQQQPPPPKLTDEELEEFVKMFPNLDKDIIASVFTSSGGDKEAMVNHLLQMSAE